MGMTKKQALEHFTKLANDHGLDEATRAAFATALGNERFADDLAKGFMLESDYGASKRKISDELKQKEEEYAKKYQELATWAQQHNVTVQQAQQVLSEYEKYVQVYGKLEDGKQQQQNAPPAGLTADQVQKLLEARDQQQAQLIGSFSKDLAKMQSDHFRRFKEPVDVDAFEAHLTDLRKTDPSIGIYAAYQSWIEPKVEEARKAEFEAAIKRAKEEAIRDFSSTHKVPVDSGQKEYSPAWDPQRSERLKKSEDQIAVDVDAAMYDAWNKAAVASVGQ